jgi:hypothetical protein
MSKPLDIVFLFDVDNTLIDNDRVQADLKSIWNRHTESLRATGTGKSLKDCGMN